MQGNFSRFCFCLLTFFKINFFNKKIFRITIRVLNGLNLDQDHHSVGPDPGPNSLFAKVISRGQKSLLVRRVKMNLMFSNFTDSSVFLTLSFMNIHAGLHPL